MVVSQKPVVVGNTPGKEPLDHFALVAFVGQVFVKVTGPVKSGQYVIASGKNDGLGIAKDKEALTESDYSKIVGQAWETSDKTNLRLVKVAITPLDFANTSSKRLENLEKENKQLRSDLQEIQKMLRKR